MINPKIKRLTESLERDENGASSSRDALVLDMVGTGKRVLDVGCSRGELSRQLAAAGNRVAGIEIDESVADEARLSCEDVVVADLDARELAEIVPGQTFDVVVFANVLEYLRDPRRLLEQTRGFLAPGGYAVIGLPNIAHGSFRLALLRGRFEAQDGSSLERPSLRFFTLKSIHELCFRAGFRVVEVARTKASIFAGSAQKFKPADFDREILRDIETDPEHDTLQFVIRAAPLTDDERLAALVDIAVEAELQYNGAHAKLMRAMGEVGELRQRSSELEERLVDYADVRSRLELAEEEVARSNARLDHVPDFERRLAAAEERALALRARGDALAERVRSADERLIESERRNDALRVEAAAFNAHVTAIRSALERANDDLVASREDKDRALAAHSLDVSHLRDAVANLQGRVDAALELAGEASRERDAAFAAREAADEARRRLQDELDDSRALGEQRAGAIEDLRFELERETMNLSDVLADRERVRKSLEAQQSAATAFFTHVEAELVRTRREILHIDGMIRAVQTSRWWLLKRALGKAKRIAVATIRRRT